jgi:hypothetical protein
MTANNSWTTKDMVIAIPLFGSGLALAWEVGYFLRIRGGAFNMFSVAEHLSFALQALPFAILAVAFGAVVFFRGFIPRVPETTSIKARLKSIAPLLLIALLIMIVTYLNHKMLAFITTFSIAVILLGFFGISNVSGNSIALNVTLAGVAMFTATIALGFDLATNDITSRRPLNVIKPPMVSCTCACLGRENVEYCTLIPL